MKPRTILRQGAQAALAAFGQLVLEEGGRWVVQEMKRRKGGRGKSAIPATLLPIIQAGAKLIETQWSQIASASAGSRRAGSTRSRVIDVDADAERRDDGDEKPAEEAAPKRSGKRAPAKRRKKK